MPGFPGLIYGIPKPVLPKHAPSSSCTLEESTRSAQTETGYRPSNCRSRSIPIPKGSRIAAISLNDQEPSSG